IPVESKAPPYSPHRDAAVPGDNIALIIEDKATRARAFYAPGLAHISEDVRAAMRSAQLVLVDGTFWTDMEMIDLGLSHKRAGEIGHLSQCGGEGKPGMIAHLDALPAGTRKVLIHINNTNPVLDRQSAEYAKLRAHGIELAEDGSQLQV
ncbi:MAG: MBL fold metallo-hydrolase, partial [Trinickia sp.]